jgi:hypothetical protein
MRSFALSSSESMSTSIGSLLVGGVCLTLHPPPEDLELASADEVGAGISEPFDSGVLGFRDFDAFEAVKGFSLRCGTGFWLDFSAGGLPKKLIRLFCFMLLSFVFAFAGAILGTGISCGSEVAASRKAEISRR